LDTSDVWRVVVPAAGVDSLQHRAVRSGSATWVPAPKDSSALSRTPYQPASIVQNDFRWGWNHRTSMAGSWGVEGRFTQVKNDAVENDLMAGVRFAHAWGPWGVRHRLSSNAVAYRPWVLTSREQRIATPADTAVVTTTAYDYTNAQGLQELDTLTRTVVDSFVSYERWSWVELAAGELTTLRTLQYDLGLDRIGSHFALSLDGSVRGVLPNTAGIRSEALLHGAMTVSVFSELGALSAGVSRGDLFLLDQSATLSTVPSLRDYAVDLGASWVPRPGLRLGYGFRLDQLDEYSSLSHTLALTWTWMPAKSPDISVRENPDRAKVGSSTHEGGSL